VIVVDFIGLSADKFMANRRSIYTFGFWQKNLPLSERIYFPKNHDLSPHAASFVFRKTNKMS